MMQSFRSFFKLKNLVFIKNASQVAILKIEHCKYILNLVAYISTFTFPFFLYFENVIRLRKNRKNIVY